MHCSTEEQGELVQSVQNCAFGLHCLGDGSLANDQFVPKESPGLSQLLNALFM